MDIYEAQNSTQEASMKVLVADSEHLSRNCIKSILENPELNWKIEEAESADEIIERISTGKPDVILIKDNLKDMPGLKALKIICNFGDQCPNVIFMDSENTDVTFIEALAHGAHGYFTLEMNPQKLIQAIKVVAGGDLWIDSSNISSVATCAKDHLTNKTSGKAPAKDALTSRELEVLNLVAEGKSNSDISQVLEISLHTTKSHIRNILTKLNVSDRSEAADVLRSSIPQKVFNSNS